MDEVKRIYTETYSEPFDECLDDSIDQYEFCTDAENACFMIRKGSKYMQDFLIDERAAALLDAYNTLIGGKPSHCTLVD